MDFKKLKVWQKAHVMSLNVYRAAGRIRSSQFSSLKSQLTRAALSVPTNIVEGRRQNSEKEFRRFLTIALNSSTELEYHLIVAKDLELLSAAEFTTLLSQVVEVRKMLYGLIAKISNNPKVRSPLTAD